MAGVSTSTVPLSIRKLQSDGGFNHPIRSLGYLAAGTFEPGGELDELLAFTYAEHRRDLA